MINGDMGKVFRKYDMSFFSTAGAIFFIGVLNLYSATHSDTGQEIYKFQILKFLLALCLGAAISFIHPKTLFRYSYLFYGINVVLLALVLIVGKYALGAQRWLALGPIRFQPSEMMKISLILALSRWFTKANADRELNLKDLLVPAFFTAIPAVLIVVQPDLGTGMVLLGIFAITAFYRRLSWRSILILGILGIACGSVMYRFGLKEYQRNRIRTFINPQVDARGSGYNAIQSEIAIGSGQLLGKGFKKSSQASLNYLPENHTDFVFSVYNEEHGFVGSVVLITLFVLLIFRFLWLATSVNKFYESILAIGLMSILFSHTVINMGMVTGLLPIVGIPLPLMSYGGSSLITFIVCCGMATSISNSRNLF